MDQDGAATGGAGFLLRWPRRGGGSPAGLRVRLRALTLATPRLSHLRQSSLLQPAPPLPRHGSGQRGRHDGQGETPALAAARGKEPPGTPDPQPGRGNPPSHPGRPRDEQADRLRLRCVSLTAAVSLICRGKSWAQRSPQLAYESLRVVYRDEHVLPPILARWRANPPLPPAETWRPCRPSTSCARRRSSRSSCIGRSGTSAGTAAGAVLLRETGPPIL